MPKLVNREAPRLPKSRRKFEAEPEKRSNESAFDSSLTDIIDELPTEQRLRMARALEKQAAELRMGMDCTFKSHEWKIISIRECLSAKLIASPSDAVEYWRANIQSAAAFNPDVECLIVLMLNARSKIIGHHLVSTGTLNSIHVYLRELFRCAVIGAAARIIIMHNHPSGDPTPSDDDVLITKKIMKGGMLLGIDLIDHLVVAADFHGGPISYQSLKQLGYII